jgi:hypothetical protein
VKKSGRFETFAQARCLWRGTAGKTKNDEKQCKKVRLAKRPKKK